MTATRGLLDLVWRRPYALLPLPPLFWAGNLVIGRAFAQELPPFGLTFWRWVVASAVLLPFVWRDLVAHRRALLAHWPVIIGCAASGFAGYPVLNYLGLHSTPAATAAMLNSTLPLMVPIFAWAITREAPRPRVVAGIALSFLGVGWIVGRGDPATLAALSIGGGEILVLLAVAGFALYSILLRWRPGTVPPMAFLAATTLAACVLMAPFWIFEEAAGRSVPFAPWAIASLLFIGVFSSLLGNLFWNRCVAALGPALTGASFHLMAVYSAALAFLLLGEPVHGFHLVGIGLILLGFAIAVLPGGTAASILRLPSQISRAFTDCLSRSRERSETRSGSG
ncbi:DMT family transporter [Mycobacterium sp. KBS0706]|uniref:DMT family transporter n=1 Tax=Mycobacterium sp. KBS0706 TaxID=2578109 RepID=UPI00110FA8D5|nr:DMT family transporter [Mycobacterium sp. KBS0706]TSD87571.1 DMT family transporter [Mycobacterium sp. KBS0706]